MEYKEDMYLQISGLQHFVFCRRQWALIHLEQQWAENLLTTEGHIFHEKAHDSGSQELRGNVLVTRGLAIYSRTLGVSGVCDVVEFHRTSDGITLHGRDGMWKPYLIEYKRGALKANDADRLQLCAQGMCLEEMLCCTIPEGALFYGETRRREKVVFTEKLREQVRTYLAEMHRMDQCGHTPKVKPTKSCNACSLREICLPKLCRNKSVREYLRAKVEDLP